MIIFDEYTYCENLISTKVKNFFQNDLNLLAKYWIESYSEKEVLKKLKEWCLWQDPNYNLITNRDRFRKAISQSKKYGLRKKLTIIITQNEINSIKKVEDYNQQKILFCMLVTSIYFKYNINRKKPNTTPSNHGVFFNKNIRDIFRIANVKVSAKEWNKIKHEWYLLGLINPFRQSTGNNFRINFYDDSSIPVIAIDDYRNIVAYYQKYLGEDIINCEKCGVMINKNNYNHRMCKNCWKEKRKLIKREWFRKNKAKNLEHISKTDCE